MKLSIWSSYYHELNAEEMIDEFIKNGLYTTELSDEHGHELFNRDEDYIETGRKFAQFIKERNFEISQGHLWLDVKICKDKDSVGVLCKWIDMYEAIGIKNMVLHCDNLFDTDLSKEEKTELNIQSLKKIAEHVEDKDVTICLENLRYMNDYDKVLVDESVDDLLNIIDRVGSDRFGICLDTGHLNLTLKNQREFILKAGDKLKALHITDNQGTMDQHIMPYTVGNIDFIEVVKTLKEIGYSGVFNLEIPGEGRIPLELRNEKIKYIRACYNYLMK